MGEAANDRETWRRGGECASGVEDHPSDDDRVSGTMRVAAVVPFPVEPPLVALAGTPRSESGLGAGVLRATSRGPIIGSDPRTREAIRTLERVASSNCTVLVTGESGTGKELAVAALHDASPRRHGPLVAVNCGAIPENLIESELFGHARGAFTDAKTALKGRVAQAEGGTLFLDEIGELPLQVQVKILRLLQQREYSPLGDSRVVKCDIRIVAATNRDLEVEVAEKRFREDLFYRLNVIHVHLPALRERSEDVELLVKHFFQVCALRAGREDLFGIDSAAMALLVKHDWPGNVRALENTVERAVLLSAGPFVGVVDLPSRITGREIKDRMPTALPDDGIDLRRAVEVYENALIREALQRTGWNKNQAARLLGINRTTLVEMVKRKKLA